LNVDQGKNNKRPNEAGPQTPVSAKKAKNATPGKSGGKYYTHMRAHNTLHYYIFRRERGYTYSLELIQ
jgi:hypothetical protein